jgi:hypothetical protein
MIGKGKGNGKGEGAFSGKKRNIFHPFPLSFSFYRNLLDHPVCVSSKTSLSLVGRGQFYLKTQDRGNNFVFRKGQAFSY